MPDPLFGSIFEYPGLDAWELVAAAWTLNRTPTFRQQWKGPEQVILAHTTLDHIVDKKTQYFLDAIAYIFARSKAGDSPEHVSASALCRRPDRKSRQYTLYVAKNKGLQNDDNAILSKLEDWFHDELDVPEALSLEALSLDSTATMGENRDDGSPDEDAVLSKDDQQMSEDLKVPEAGTGAIQQAGNDNIEENAGTTSEDEDAEDLVDAPPYGSERDQNDTEEDHFMWKTIRSHSFRRQLYYILSITFRDLEDEPPEHEVRSPDSKQSRPVEQSIKEIKHLCWEFVANYFKTSKNYLKLARPGHKKENEAAREGRIKDMLAEVDTNTDEQLKSVSARFLVKYETLCTITYDFRRSGRPYWKNPKSKDSCYGQTVRAIIQLGRLRASWKAIKDWRADKAQSVSDIQLLPIEQKREFQLDLSKVRQKILSWPQNKKSKYSALPSDSEKVLCYFHCELQMLDFMTGDTDREQQCLNYFGCSKKSCWICWAVLGQHPRFRTRSTHAKVYYQCALPFADSIISDPLYIYKGLLHAQRALVDSLYVLQWPPTQQETPPWQVETSYNFGSDSKSDPMALTKWLTEHENAPERHQNFFADQGHDLPAEDTESRSPRSVDCAYIAGLRADGSEFDTIETKSVQLCYNVPRYRLRANHLFTEGDVNVPPHLLVRNDLQKIVNEDDEAPWVVQYGSISSEDFDPRTLTPEELSIYHSEWASGYEFISCSVAVFFQISASTVSGSNSPFDTPSGIYMLPYIKFRKESKTYDAFFSRQSLPRLIDQAIKQVRWEFIGDRHFLEKRFHSMIKHWNLWEQQRQKRAAQALNRNI
ncbi:MAG: hypothetical protein Q9157_003424 [Trypethelium eluteriae]